MAALVWAGNYYLLRNETASYVPLFRACAEEFPGAARADYCLEGGLERLYRTERRRQPLWRSTCGGFRKARRRQRRCIFWEGWRAPREKSRGQQTVTNRSCGGFRTTTTRRWPKNG
jgi:hypothetical protein